MALIGLKKMNGKCKKIFLKTLTFDRHNVIMLMTVKKEVDMTEKKLGRPTDNPKNTKLTVRVDAETLEILEKYCKKENISKMEGIRRGIRKLDK